MRKKRIGRMRKTTVRKRREMNIVRKKRLDKGGQLRSEDMDEDDRTKENNADQERGWVIVHGIDHNRG